VDGTSGDVDGSTAILATQTLLLLAIQALFGVPAFF